MQFVIWTTTEVKIRLAPSKQPSLTIKHHTLNQNFSRYYHPEIPHSWTYIHEWGQLLCEGRETDDDVYYFADLLSASAKLEQTPYRHGTWISMMWIFLSAAMLVRKSLRSAMKQLVVCQEIRYCISIIDLIHDQAMLQQ